MKISLIKIKGFRSFGPTEVSISIEHKLVAFIGLNSSGKTTALDAFRKVFGSSSIEQEFSRDDFHFGKDESKDTVTNKSLSIEIHFYFSKEEKEAVPHFFSQMVVDTVGGEPYIRIRLEATWAKSEIEPDGIIESRLYYITVAKEEDESEDSRQLFPNYLRPLIQIIYIPAIRKPSEQLKYGSGTILYRVLRKIKWKDEFKKEFDKKIEEINTDFKALPELTEVQESINGFWAKFHKDERYKDTALEFGGSDFDSILKKIEISFTPTPSGRKFSVNDLGEGYRSLFYLTLVCALLDIEENAVEDDELIGIHRPLLTILAIEEPENHIAPQILGRVIKILTTIAKKQNSQVLLSSHTPAIVRRLDPESIFHFRISEHYETVVNNVLLPEKKDEAYKYIKQAVQNYPEIYFAKLVVIGEGDSEEILFNRLMHIMDIDFDDNIITFAPLGHRFVNHIWKLLESLSIPYVTLLDLDSERNGGDWGRIKYGLVQLIETGQEKQTLLGFPKGILSDKQLDEMHKWPIDMTKINIWKRRLSDYNVFYSAPLDLDFLMLEYYAKFYNKAIPKGGGPRIPDKDLKEDEFKAKLDSAIHVTLKSETAIASTYTEEQKELMIWYNYHFLGRSKPGTHIEVLSNMTDDDIRNNLPPVFDDIFKRIAEILKIEV